MTTTLVVIDPQNDFVAVDGALSVPGAVADMKRLAAFVDACEADAIWVSLDAHHVHDISHPGWWVNADGTPPVPFTRISAEDVAAGRFRTADPANQGRSAAYLASLDASGRYPHVIWPEHCLLGDPGSNVWPGLSRALHAWERRTGRTVHFVLKGTNPWTEHFSAVRAEVPDPDEAASAAAAAMVEAARTSDRVFVAGEARSHCVANTVRDLCDAVGPSLPSRLVLLSDATSDVPGFEAFGDSFVTELTGRGMTLATTATALP